MLELKSHRSVVVYNKEQVQSVILRSVTLLLLRRGESVRAWVQRRSNTVTGGDSGSSQKESRFTAPFSRPRLHLQEVRSGP